MCYPGLDPSLMCEVTSDDVVLEVPDLAEGATSA
jgi:hypothetical protein